MSPTSPIILPYKGIRPKFAQNVFVAPGASVIGNVELKSGSSVWFGCVLRGDERAIRVGENTNIQDLTVIHTSRQGRDAEIGANVTVGHRVVLHGCTVGDSVLIGIGAIVLDDVSIESGSIVAAGAVVTAGKHIRAGEVWAGCPALCVGEVKGKLAEFIASTPSHYREKAANYLLDLPSCEGRHLSMRD